MHRVTLPSHGSLDESSTFLPPIGAVTTVVWHETSSMSMYDAKVSGTDMAVRSGAAAAVGS